MSECDCSSVGNFISHYFNVRNKQIHRCIVTENTYQFNRLLAFVSQICEANINPRRTKIAMLFMSNNRVCFTSYYC